MSRILQKISRMRMASNLHKFSSYNQSPDICSLSYMVNQKTYASHSLLYLNKKSFNRHHNKIKVDETDYQMTLKMI